MVYGNYISIRDLWAGFNPDGVAKGIFVLFRGYMDESASEQGEVFCLSCLIGDGAQWIRLCRDWKAILDEKNGELAAQGRRQITRYHASPCSNRQGEFKGWSTPEQREFFGKLFDVLQGAHLHVVSYTLDWKYALEKFPFMVADPEAWAYYLALHFVMGDVGKEVEKMHPSRRITMFHDRTKFNGKISDAFYARVGNPKFPYASRFVSIASLSWEDCIALQPADLFAYETMKETERKYFQPRDKPRKSLNMLRSMSSLGGVHKHIGRDEIDNFESQMMGLSG